ncbi:MAG: hypothetical protein HC876_06210 [Chloroflexaceae bacterium]|nr:hypothetical protein [Chloroflexaceae bacterium]
MIQQTDRHTIAISKSATRLALQVTLLYILPSISWILFSDWLVETLAPPEWQIALQGWKALGFVIISAAIIYIILRTIIIIQRRTETTLRLQKTILESQIDASPDGVLVLDLHGEVCAFNQRLVDLWQVPAEIIEQRRYNNILEHVLNHVAYPEQLSSQIAYQHQHPHAVCRDELVLCDGRVFERFTAPINDAGGTHYGRVVQYHDITSLKQAQSLLEQRNHDLDVLNRMTCVVNQLLELPRLLATIRQMFQEEMLIPAGAIYLYHEEADNLSLAECWGLLAPATSTRYAIAAPTHEQLVVSGEVIVGPAYRPDVPLRPAADAVPGTHISAYVGVPLMAGGEVQAIVDLFDVPRVNYSTRQLTGDFFKLFGQQAGQAMQRACLFADVQQAHERLRTLSHALVEVQEHERRAIACELHDEVGQILTGLNLALEMTTRLPAEQVADRVAEARIIVNDLMLRVRELSLALRPPMLDDLGLLPTLIWHIKHYTARSGVRVVLKHTGLERRFAPRIETAAYRIIQEALTNVARYAHVHEVVVRVWVYSSLLGIQIEDHGVGFDPEASLSKHATAGLSGMRERVLLLNGSFELETAPGQGCRIAVELPICEDDRVCHSVSN